jgi:hypothetical protein
MNTLVFSDMFSHRFPSTLVLPVPLGWQVDLCKSSCSHIPQIPKFLRSLNRLIHTTSFILNLPFNFNLISNFSKLFFYISFWLCSNTVQFQLLKIIFLIMDLCCIHCLIFLFTNSVKIILIHLRSIQALSNFFHMLLLCNFCHIYFNYAYFFILFMITIFSVCVVLFYLQTHYFYENLPLV